MNAVFTHPPDMTMTRPQECQPVAMIARLMRYFDIQPSDNKNKERLFRTIINLPMHEKYLKLCQGYSKCA